MLCVLNSLRRRGWSERRWIWSSKAAVSLTTGLIVAVLTLALSAGPNPGLAAPSAALDIRVQEVEGLELIRDADPEPEPVEVEEGKTASFRVRLNLRPNADVQVSLQIAGDPDISIISSTLLIFTPDDYNVWQTVTIKAAHDPDHDDGTATIWCTSPALADSLMVEVVEIDNLRPLIVLDPNPVNVPEGGSITVNVSLSVEAAGNIPVHFSFLSGDPDITISTPSPLVFLAGASTIPQTITLVDSGNSVPGAGLTYFTFSAPSLQDTILEARRVENPDPAILIDRTEVTVPEEGTAIFKVRLNRDPGSDLVVNVAPLDDGSTVNDPDITVVSGGSLTFTSSNWSVEQTVTLGAADDVDIVNGQATIVCTSGDLVPRTVLAFEQDNDEVALKTSVLRPTVPEGGTSTFGLSLVAKPEADVEVQVARLSGDPDITIISGAYLVFSPLNWNIEQTVTLHAFPDIDTVDGKAIIRCGSPETAEVQIPNLDITVSEIDDDVVDIVLSKSTVIVPEGATAAFQVKLAAQPAGTTRVTIARESGDEDLSVASATYLDFTPANWNQNQSVTLRAAEDYDVVNGQATFSLTIQGMPPKYVVAIEQDNDILGINAPKNTVVIPEGSVAVAYISLTAQPPTNVVVQTGKTIGDPDISITGGNVLIFTPSDWYKQQPIFLSAAEDFDAIDGQATFRCSAAGVPAVSFTAREADNDVLSIRFRPPFMAVPEGTSAPLAVVLTAQPLQDVTIEVSHESGDTSVSVDLDTTLTFTPADWNIEQVVTVSAAEDADEVSDSAVIRFEGTGVPSRSMTIYTIDNDALQIETSTASLDVPEGTAVAFQVRLSAAPTSEVNVFTARVAGDQDIKIKSGAALKFDASNYDQWQTVTVSADKDADAIEGQATIRCSASGLESRFIVASEVESDSLRFVANVSSVMVPEGFTVGFPVQLSAKPVSNVNVQVTVEGDSDISVLYAESLVFTPANWNVYQTITLQAAHDDDINMGAAIVRLSAPGIADLIIMVVESDDDAVRILVDPATVSVPENGTASFAVELAAKPNADVVVALQTVPGDNDISLVTAGPLTFTPEGPKAWNVPQTVTVAAARDLDTLNGESTVRLSGAGLSAVEVTVVEVDDGVVPPTWYRDADNDGFGDPRNSVPAWERPAGYVADNSDCNDADRLINPAAGETCGNLIDDNCNGQVDEGCAVQPVDSDGDGVTDDLDQCPNTPAGTLVDETGCPEVMPPADSDGDGVIDALDQCPNTPAGTPVDATGCPLVTPPADADNDGVADDLDQCPDTPAGTEVDADGCPVQTGPGDDDDDDDDSGQPIPDDDDDTDDDDNDNLAPLLPFCGAGMAQAMFGMLFCLMAMRLRRRW